VAPLAYYSPWGEEKGEEKTKKENKRALRMDGAALAMGQCCA